MARRQPQSQESTHIPAVAALNLTCAFQNMLLSQHAWLWLCWLWLCLSKSKRKGNLWSPFLHLFMSFVYHLPKSSGNRIRFESIDPLLGLGVVQVWCLAWRLLLQLIEGLPHRPVAQTLAGHLSVQDLANSHYHNVLHHLPKFSCQFYTNLCFICFIFVWNISWGFLVSFLCPMGCVHELRMTGKRGEV